MIIETLGQRVGAERDGGTELVRERLSRWVPYH